MISAAWGVIAVNHLQWPQGAGMENYILSITSTGIDADASKWKTSPGYFNGTLVYCYKCGILIAARATPFLHHRTAPEGTLTGFPHSGIFPPWEFPEISLAYNHISLKGHSRSIIYGKVFWPPHTPPPYSQPGLHLPSTLAILFFSVFLSFNYLFWECRQNL